MSQHVCEASKQSLHEQKGHTKLNVNKLKIQDWKLHTHILHHFSSFVHKWYVVVTYQPHAYICNSCKRYVVVTYRSVIYTPWKSTYPIRVIAVSWCRLGRTNYGTNGYSFTFPTVFFIVIRCYFYNYFNWLVYEIAFSIDLCNISSKDWQFQQVCNNYYSY